MQMRMRILRNLLVGMSLGGNSTGWDFSWQEIDGFGFLLLARNPRLWISLAMLRISLGEHLVLGISLVEKSEKEYRFACMFQIG